jgi:Peptidase family M1 domain
VHRLTPPSRDRGDVLRPGARLRPPPPWIRATPGTNACRASERAGRHDDCCSQGAVRSSALLLPLAVALAPADSAAMVPVVETTDELLQSHLLHRLVERERSALSGPSGIVGSPSLLGAIPRPPYVVGAASAMDCVHATHDITLDPVTGETTATLELRVKAVGKALAAVGFAVDEGLEAGAATATNREATVGQSISAPMRIVQITLSPALAPGQETVITVPYRGTLSCAPAAGSAAVCSKSDAFSYFAHQSVFPYIYDPDAPDNFVLDALTRDIVLRVPAADEVVATGQKVSQVIDGRTKVSRWSIDKPLSRFVGLYAFVGKLGLKPVAGRTVPTTLVFPTPEQSIDQSLVSWSTPALDFVEKSSGATLPFDRSLSLVRLPQAIGDPGTATFGMTLLSDSYAKTGDLLYEETWAHENAHLFWGIVVPETDATQSRLMSEGMATLTQIDYSFARHFGSEDRDLYLARRFLPMGLDLRMHGRGLPPVQLLAGAELPEDFRTRRYTLWAYYRSAITLDHLRVTIGDEQFAGVLSAYMARCSFVGCRPDALREIVTERTGQDMTTFFDRWVTASERPVVVVGFTPVTGGADIELTKDDDRPMTLELWLGLEDGQRVKRRVDLGPRTTRLHVDAPAPVLSVATSPRHDVLVDVRSAVDGDLDFDGETDGFDVLRCARLVGRSYESKGATGLWKVNETFDPRCDVNGDFTIDDEDLAQVTKTFGKLRAR